MSKYDLVNTFANRVARDYVLRIDFDLFYAPMKGEMAVALGLNEKRGWQSVRDGRTRGARYLKRLREKAWHEYRSAHN